MKLNKIIKCHNQRTDAAQLSETYDVAAIQNATLLEFITS